ncbi:MAG: ABC transporter ATP-binding protein [Acidilobaceae archaeon]
MLRDYSIIAESLSKEYSRGVWGIVDVSLNVRAGEICALLGPNGAGKTTTVGVLSTLLKPTGGRAYVNGYDILREPHKVREISAIVPQDGRPDAYWTPREAIKWYLVVRGFSLSRAERETSYWLERLGLSSIKDVPVIELSGGQRKRVLVAMALASGAEVFFLDEPSSGLDIEGKHELLKALREVRREGRTVLLTTHDIREAELAASSIAIINKGRVVVHDTPTRLIESLPYGCRVVVREEGVDASELSTDARAKLGDSTILYFSSCREAESLARSLGLRAEKLGVEDVYLHYVVIKGGSR